MIKTLRGKFTLVYAGLALLTALVGFAGVWNIYRLGRSVDDLMTANYKSIDAVSHMMEAAERQDSALLIWVGVDKARGVELFASNGGDFIKWFEVEKGNRTEPAEGAVIEALSADYNAYSRALYDLQALPGGVTPGQYYTETANPLFEKIKSECRELIAINERAMFASKQKTTDFAWNSMVVLLVISLALMAFGYIMAHFLIKRFLKPLKLLEEGIRRVRGGNMDERLDVRANDETGRLAGEFNDMTLRLRDFEQSSVGTLMAERNRSIAILNSISDPLLVLDTGWRILLINDACGGFFGIGESRAAGRHFLEAIPDGELFAAVEQLAGDSGDHGRVVCLRRGGEHYFNLMVRRLNDPEEYNGGYVVAFQNVTGLKELERVRTDFLATISHEFKTPLTSVMMAASMLEEGGMGALNAEQEDAVRAIREDGETLLGLVNSLLELMRIESGKEVYRFALCSARQIVEAALESFRDLAARKGVSLVDAMPDGLPDVRADSEKIRWVLNNLIGNALKATAEGGAVTVEAVRSGNFVEFSVRDTGEGIPPEYLEKIFDRFVQVEGRDVEVRGTGLGLTVSREIVRDHGGDIWADSIPGAGSTFTFTLPIAGEPVNNTETSLP